ncbi:MAG: arginase family protein, partial [Candidatus Kariarchaeaceae archaeon]
NNIEQAMNSLLSQSEAPIISIGGDHSIVFPLVKPLANRGSVGMVWFDAHRDLLNELSGSKYSHGCPLRRIIEIANVNPENVLLVGTRYFTEEEQQVVDDMGIQELTMVDLEESDSPRNLFKAKMKEISQVDNLYVSVDIDVLDPGFAPGTGTPVGGGMMTRELLTLINDIEIPVRAFDIVEVAPPLDPSGVTIKTALTIISEMLAKVVIQIS